MKLTADQTVKTSNSQKHTREMCPSFKRLLELRLIDLFNCLTIHKKKWKWYETKRKKECQSFLIRESESRKMVSHKPSANLWNIVSWSAIHERIYTFANVMRKWEKKTRALSIIFCKMYIVVFDERMFYFQNVISNPRAELWILAQ